MINWISVKKKIVTCDAFFHNSTILRNFVHLGLTYNWI